ncbi:MAG: hypothetical protein HFF44_05395 [Lawsonibacter sp.]|nr:hypothetical protein [Lawsonibacter sp.]
MAELIIRRNRGISLPQYTGVSRTEKQTGSSQVQRADKTPVTLSKTLEQLMDRVGQAESHTRESRRALQTGEAVLSEVKDSLDRMAQLAREAGGSTARRSALQSELEQLRGDIDRMIASGTAGGTPLFLDGDTGVGAGTEALLYAVMGELSAPQGGDQGIPDWLMRGIAQALSSPDQLLSALGLDKNASGAELLAAIQNVSLEDSSAAGALAALYLGAVISGSDPSQTFDPQQAAAGLQQLLEKVGEGLSLDESIALLTNGQFTSLADFQSQFTGGSAPGLQEFLLLLADGGGLSLSGSPLMSLLAGMEGVNLDLLMGILSALPGADAAGQAMVTAEGAPPASGDVAADGGNVPPTLQLGTMQVTGRDLSGVSFQAETNTLIAGGTANITIQGAGKETILITGSGAVTLQNVEVSQITVDSPAARLFTAGTNVLASLQLREGAGLTLEGSGLLRLGTLAANQSNTLRLAGGAVVIQEEAEEAGKPLSIPLIVEGPVSLAGGTVQPTAPDGKPLEAFDLVWKALGLSSITSLALDGKQVKMALMSGEPARLWLSKGEHGSPIHTLLLQGRDKSGQPHAQYAYLRWNQYTASFEEYSMYPNPFTITGGEAGQDWIYEAQSHTLLILSSQVTAISGGSGTDTNQTPFSGRIALADRIGPLALTLDGVVCQVSSGRAFDLGRENDVTLILENGSDNRFESGSGCAGISLGDGTSLSIDCSQPHGDGSLTATGSEGGAGIGRDSGGSRDQLSQIFIRGGVITAAGSGGGAGIGAGKQSFMGSITILGGTIDATGGMGGGAGIGGALGAPVWDINIQGGSISAEAEFHAAAIGAGVQGECGDILISGTARIVKAMGGNPGADIGACLFGGCGKVRISGEADIGSAKLSTHTGIPLQMGEETVTLPQFRLSAQALQLDDMSLLTPEQAQSAQVLLDADREWVSQIQEVYDALRSKLEQSFGNLRSVHQYINLRENLVRDNTVARTLLESMRRSILQESSQALLTHGRRGAEDVQLLLQ